jgi:uncharacterized protein YukE
MTFKVDAAEILAYAARLREAHGDAENARSYIHGHGDFSFHQSGIIGALLGRHADLMGRLEQLHGQLLSILERSGAALTTVASDYQRTDEQTAARVDATYPASPRPAPSRD